MATNDLWIILIYTLLATVVKSKQDFFSGLGLFSLPRKFAWVNFANAFTKGNLGRYMVNGLIICVLKVPLGIFVEALAAFAMTRRTAGTGPPARGSPGRSQ